MIVRVDGFDVERDKFAFSLGNGESKGCVGTEDVPKDVAKEGKYGSESIKGEKGKKDADHAIFF